MFTRILYKNKIKGGGNKAIINGKRSFVPLPQGAQEFLSHCAILSINREGERVARESMNEKDYLVYIENEISVIPVDPVTKKPPIEWKEFQERLATEHDVKKWFNYLSRMWSCTYLWDYIQPFSSRL